MKHDEAVTIFGLIGAVYDLHPERSAELSTVWVPALVDLDAEVTMQVVNAWMHGKGPEKMPNLPVFVSSVTSLTIKRNAPEPTPYREEEVPPPPLQWIVFQHLRSKHDERLLPDMEAAFRADGDKWPPEGREVVPQEEYEQLLEWAATQPRHATKRRVDPEPECMACEDEGLTGVGHHYYKQGEKLVRGAEITAPCPECPKGRALEFPLEGKGSWGEEGFWRGRRHRIVRRGEVEILS